MSESERRRRMWGGSEAVRLSLVVRAGFDNPWFAESLPVSLRKTGSRNTRLNRSMIVTGKYCVYAL